MSSNDLMNFTIVNGNVVAVYEYDDGRWERESIDRDESYYVDGTNIVKEEYDDGRLETTVYAQNANGFYQQVSKSYSPYTSGSVASQSYPSFQDSDDSDDSYSDHDSDDSAEHEAYEHSAGDSDDDSSEHTENHSSDDLYEHSDDDSEDYVFSASDDSFTHGYKVELDAEGNFAGLFEYEHNGFLENETEADSQYLFVDGVLYETELEHNGVEINIYTDRGDGVYRKVSSEYSLNEGATSTDFGLVDVALSVEGSTNDDWILMENYTESFGGDGADSFVMRDLAHSTIKDFNVTDGDRIIFDTGYGLSDADQLAQYVSELSYDSTTQTLSIDFNGSASLEIVGIASNEISWDIAQILS